VVYYVLAPTYQYKGEVNGLMSLENAVRKLFRECVLDYSCTRGEEESPLSEQSALPAQNNGNDIDIIVGGVVNALKPGYDALEEKIEKILSGFSELHDNKEKQLAEISELRAENADLKEALNNETEKSEKTEQENKSLKKENDELRQDISRLDQDNNELKQSYNRLVQKAKKLESRYILVKDDAEIWEDLEKLDEEKQEYLKQLCGGFNIDACLSLGRDEGKIKQLWSYLRDESVRSGTDAGVIEILNRYFELCIRKANSLKGDTEKYVLQEIESGTEYDGDTCIRTSDSKQNGLIKKSLTKCVRYSDSVLYKAIVKVE
jgi:regulator of replication initiation timing